MLLPLLASLALMEPETALHRYLRRPDASYRVERMTSEGDATEFRLTSQIWRGRPWRHTLMLVRPAGVKGDAAILVVTGDMVDNREVVEARQIAKAAQMPVAVLFDTPNQPIFDRREDALISHTFAKYIETGEEDWPLLFPMVKGVRRAMDALGTEAGLKRFVVTGASKRGWTSWLTAATHDARVIGIAPEVFDFLRMPEQLRHQQASYGKLSDMIGDYTSQGLDQLVGSEAGQRLVALVDPYAYRHSIKVPILAILGTNDPYWTLDGSRLYDEAFGDHLHFFLAPNEGHTIRNRQQLHEALAVFARGVRDQKKLPAFRPAVNRDGITLDRGPVAAEVWVAWSKTRDFRSARWELHDKVEMRNQVAGNSTPIGEGYLGVVVRAQFESPDKGRYWLTSRAHVLPPK